MNLSELAGRINAISQRYADIYEFERTTDWLMIKLQEEVGEVAQAWLAKSGRQRDKGRSSDDIDDSFALELADALGILLAIAEHEGVDIERAVAAKWLVWDERENQRADELTTSEQSLETETLRSGQQ